jgi:hypothetical protein
LLAFAFTHQVIRRTRLLPEKLGLKEAQRRAGEIQAEREVGLGLRVAVSEGLVLDERIALDMAALRALRIEAEETTLRLREEDAAKKDRLKKSRLEQLQSEKREQELRLQYQAERRRTLRAWDAIALKRRRRLQLKQVELAALKQKAAAEAKMYAMLQELEELKLASATAAE